MAYTTTLVNKIRRIGNQFYAYLKTNSYEPNILTSMNGSTWNPLNLEEPYSNYSCLEIAGSDSNILIAMRDQIMVIWYLYIQLMVQLSQKPPATI